MALSILAFGFLNLDKPNVESFERAFQDSAGQEQLLKQVTLLHCTSQYPAPIESANLRAMSSMQAEFGLQVGYSDHTSGILVAGVAVALGASIIEKHLTLDKSLPGPDHAASVDPSELKDMVDNIRLIEEALGDGKKFPHTAELENIDVARKSLVAAKRIEKGEKFSEENLAVKRPGSGLSPIKYWDILGRTAEKTIEFDDIIK